MAAADLVDRGRDAYERLAWDDAYTRLSAAEAQAALEADDIARLAMAAYLTGREDDAVAAWERAYHALLADGQAPRAVRCAFWIGVTLLQRGRHAQGGGWIARAQRVLDDAAVDCVEAGYLRVPTALQALMSGDGPTARAAFADIAEVADRFGDPDLVALSRLGQGQALVEMGDATRGVALLDEAMVAVTAGEVSPIVAGIVYCAVIIFCQKVFDLRRAQEWTAALSRWCEQQQGLHPYRGQCLVHRSEILQLRGEWQEAMDEAEQACSHLSATPGDPVMGMAQYQLAELHRLRGAYADAEQGYRKASEFGHQPHPGLALLRLAQGRVDAAAAAIRRVVDDSADPVARSRVLAASVEILLAAEDVEAARVAADELAGIADAFDSALLRANAAGARGAVALERGDAAAAAHVLRQAVTMWQELDAPYEAAQVRLRMARACRQLGDDDTAQVELDAARRVFEQLGAGPALAEVAELAGRTTRQAPAGLTPREVEVLGLVATGATNRQIADRLVISDKTVARHVSNIFTKLGITSRAAATAYAYEHDLV